ncbi:uncharacterized protein LOC141611602 [Silene latifolia]|uniref:uncharacterized protein LOC141611602 n=1 Tax=Silene latifolia TaxID=37657 RepID=UPI003D76B8DE
MSISGIQGHLLEVTVVGCLKLKDTEWISRQDPYVCLEYANTKFRTRTCTDGGKNPVFQEKFVFTLIEGLREINIVVWNSNTLTFDDFIGSGRAQLQDVLNRGYDDRPWPIQTKTGRYAGEVKLIMHYANAQKSDHTSYASAPPFPATFQPQRPMYTSPPSAYQPPPTCHHPQPAPYPGTSPYSYPSEPTAYSPYPYHPPNHPSAYPPSAYSQSPSAYPSSPYAPPSHASTYPPMPYPPPSHPSPYPPAGHYPGLYPPPPY